MTEITINELFESGAHFGHKKKNLHRNMAPYVYLNNQSVSIIDLKYTLGFLKDVKPQIEKVVKSKKSVIFVCAKPQCADVVKLAAESCDSPFVTHKWLGGMLTNWNTVSQSLKKLKKYQGILAKNEENEDSRYTKKELLSIKRKIVNIDRNLEGLRNLDSMPGMMIVFDTKKELTAINEAVKMKIPVLGIVDTNNDPIIVDYMIPGNDDSIKAISLYANYFARIINDSKDAMKGEGATRVFKQQSHNNKKEVVAKHTLSEEA